MSFFRSLRSKSNKSDPASEASEFGSRQPSNGASDYGGTTASSKPTAATLPASSRPERPGSLKASKSRFFSSGSQSRRKNSSSDQVNRPPNVRAPSSSAAHLPKVVDEGRAQAVTGGAPLAQTTSPASSAVDLSPPPGARPSDLFAGKGIEWGKLEFTSSGAVAATSQSPQKQDELQSFLKARRQWVPTFVTEPKDDSDIPSVNKPDDIAFSAVPETGSLLSIRDLDESHKRKQKLLGGFEANDWSREGGQVDVGTVPVVPPSGVSAAKPKSPSSPPVAPSAGRFASIAGSNGQSQLPPKKSSSISRKPVQQYVEEAAPKGPSSSRPEGYPTGQEAVVAPASSGQLPIGDSSPQVPAATAPKGDVSTTAATAGQITAGASVNGAGASSAGPNGVSLPHQAHPSASSIAANESASGAPAVRESMDTAGAFVTPSGSRTQSEAGHGLGSHTQFPPSASASAIPAGAQAQTSAPSAVAAGTNDEEEADLTLPAPAPALPLANAPTSS